jgi:hypothetical protein
MIESYALGARAFGRFLSAHPLHGRAGSHNRDFQLGSSLPSVATLNRTASPGQNPFTSVLP